MPHTDRILDSFSLLYFEDEASLAGAEQPSRPSHFASLVSEDKVGAGFRHDYFLPADENVRTPFSRPNAELVLPVWEAGFDGRVDHVHGYPGAIGVLAPLMFSIVLPNIILGDVRPLGTFPKMAAKS